MNTRLIVAARLCTSHPSARCVSTVVTAAELTRRPVLDRSATDSDTLQDLDAFPVPVLPMQLSTALRREFGRPVTTRTDWRLFPADTFGEQMRGDWHRAARLIHETLVSWRNRPGSELPPRPTSAPSVQRPSRGIAVPAQFAEAAVAWIQTECERLYGELQTGCRTRFESQEHLIPAEYAAKMSPEQTKMLAPAIASISKASQLHPSMKQEIIGHICSVILASTK